MTADIEHEYGVKTMKLRAAAGGMLFLFLSACARGEGAPAATFLPSRLEASPAVTATAEVSKASSPLPAFSPAPTSGEAPELPPPWRPLEPAPDYTAVQTIVSGVDHTCAITPDGRVMCWGGNRHGQLGDGTTTDRNSPVYVNWLSGVTALAAGWGHTCALTREGAVWCWGYNQNGELGLGTTDEYRSPRKVDRLEEPATLIAAGDDHTCAVTTSGGLWCWGYDKDHQLIRFEKMEGEFSSVPVRSAYAPVDSVAAGWGHTCALSRGEVECWGNNENGQLGVASVDALTYYARVEGLPEGVVELAAYGGHTCARTGGGGVWCWGDNRYGQLGDGTTVDRFAPVKVFDEGSGITAIRAGWDSACAVSAGGLQCWGRNDSGQLGDGTRTDRHAPVRVEGLAGKVHDAAAGRAHTCALLTDGSAACWGSNASGQLGNGGRSDSRSPVGVRDFSGFTAVRNRNPSSTLAAGRYHTCAVADDGGVKCWGGNEYGQLGDGSTAAGLVPRDVVGLTGAAVAVAAGSFHTCAILADGGVACWGANGNGRLGNGSTADSAVPKVVKGLTGAVDALALGDRHSCALLRDGQVACWGANDFGQGTAAGPQNLIKPVLINNDYSGRRAIAIAAGADFTCALYLGGGVRCWGDNSSGQLPGVLDTSFGSPVDIVGLASGFSALAAGERHACALSGSGLVQCWGSNDRFQLGGGTADPRVYPDWVRGLEGVARLDAGGNFTCAAMSAGGIACWGGNEFGQLGNGAYSDSGTAVRAGGISEMTVEIAAGEFHACAVAAETVLCWGDNRSGQLGNGTTISSSVPLDIQQPVSAP